MRNELTDDPNAIELPEPEAVDATPAAPAETSTPMKPLVILVADDDLVCVDDLCLPAEDRP